MEFLENLKSDLEKYRPRVEELQKVFDIDNSRDRIAELHEKASEPSFWDDLDNSQKILQETKNLEGKIAKYEKLHTACDDIEVMIEIACEEDDDSMLDEIKNELTQIYSELEKIKLETLLTGQYDSRNCILTLHAGAGGTEAQDWTEMLYRMYCRWAEKHGFKVSVMDILESGDAGFKSASIFIEGENAYGYLKSEAGIHRLVRISPFDSSGSRHTSFSAVDVMPEIDESIQVEIRPEDIKMDVFRSSGAGGQHINKTSSAVRLTHIPTGLVASCQTQRSQVQNRKYAMMLLTAQLVKIKEQEHLDQISDIKGVQKEIAWGSQIRSYVFMPYTLVKDTRTQFETTNVSSVMDGELDGFINAYLRCLSLGTLGNS